MNVLDMLHACMQQEVPPMAEFHVVVPAQNSGEEPKRMQVIAFNVEAGNVVLSLAPLP